MRSFFRYLGDGDALADYSAPTPARPMPHPLPEGIEGVIRMVNACKKESHKALIGFCGLGGLRVAEAIDMRVSDLQTDGDRTMTVRGKGDKTRIVPITSKCWTVICPQVVDAFLSGAPTVVGLGDRQAREAITNAAKRAGLKRHVSSHDLRATFATAAYDRSRNLRAVQELLGHSSSNTTEVYIGVRMATMRDAAEVWDDEG